MEYIYMIIANEIIQYFNGICIAIKAYEQILVLCITIIRFIQ